MKRQPIAISSLLGCHDCEALDVRLVTISADEYGSELSSAEDNGGQKSESSVSAIVKNIRVRSITDSEQYVPIGSRVCIPAGLVSYVRQIAVHMVTCLL